MRDCEQVATVTGIKIVREYYMKAYSVKYLSTAISNLAMLKVNTSMGDLVLNWVGTAFLVHLSLVRKLPYLVEFYLQIPNLYNERFLNYSIPSSLQDKTLTSASIGNSSTVVPYRICEYQLIFTVYLYPPRCFFLKEQVFRSGGSQSELGDSKSDLEVANPMVVRHE
ncbi:hypothetical protein BDP27DRAFT_1368337 [Rhodocollybia butyracea]|uniref:Uncharacterized protein n=1 Tax=Rhodocollybia butyracea TaxID=206335 RepID=A0A9P5PI54_9AGAR|nr:hypothetical protein BDP27DRAFT_1368337 [Rhodocollybia butyracea]